MANKLLLLKDVESLGRSGDVVNVRPGYARNFLLPQSLAVIASPQTLKMQARLQEERKKKALEDKKEAEAAAERLNALALTCHVKVDHEGHMYGSVTALEVVHLLKEQLGLEIEKKAIQLKHSIKTTGAHKIGVKLKEGVSAQILLKVLVEGQEEEPEALSEGEEP